MAMKLDAPHDPSGPQAANAQHGELVIAYVLRLRRCDGNWQALLVDPQNNTRTGFADLESLFAFLIAKTDTSQ
jgi:hypothetical protein